MAAGASARRPLVQDHALLLDALEEAETEDPDGTVELQETIERVRAQYVAALPRVTISRAPSGELLERSVDIVDLDGPFWDYRRPARPFASPSDGCVALDGALRLDEASVASAPFLASPGAARPTVVPRLFSDHGARAVLSSLQVGPHAGFVVAYFSPSPDPTAPLLDDWGAAEHWRSDARGDWVLAHRPDHEVERDADLERWIDSGDLCWIAPGDGDWTLRESTADCPYLALDGVTSRQYVQFGKVWSDPGSEEVGTVTER